MSATMTTPQLAEILFASTLQESDQPTPAEIRLAVSRMLARGRGAADCLACLAQEAGDHPDTYVARMRWALRAVEIAYAAPAAARRSRVSSQVRSYDACSRSPTPRARTTTSTP